MSTIEVRRVDGASEKTRRIEELKHMGLALLVMLVMLVLVAVVFLFNVPNPNMLLITGLAVFASLYGYGPGIVCAAVMILYSMYFFSEGHSMFRYTLLNLQKMGMIVLSAVLNTLFIGNLKRQHNAALRKLQNANRFLEDDNRALEEASLFDELTGVRNRQAFRRDYERFENSFIHVMMLDLDDFKQINDTCGHPMGDYALKQVGRMLAECFGGANCYRYGGDEFLVVDQRLDEQGFVAKMGELKERIKQIRIGEKGTPLHFSAGFVFGECEMAFDLRMMLHQADTCLYEAKDIGKDCYVGRAFSRDAGHRKAMPD